MFFLKYSRLGFCVFCVTPFISPVPGGQKCVTLNTPDDVFFETHPTIFINYQLSIINYQLNFVSLQLKKYHLR